jgi:hypothetical protein
LNDPLDGVHYALFKLLQQCQMASAINDARTMTRLDELSRAIWQGWGANAVTDDQAQELASLKRWTDNN